MGLRNILCSIQKEKKGWWKRLLKSEEKHPYIKVDWNKWCDEDEESGMCIRSTCTDACIIFFSGGSLNSLLAGYKKKAMLQLNSSH